MVNLLCEASSPFIAPLDDDLFLLEYVSHVTEEVIINVEYWVPKRNLEAFYQDVNKFMGSQPIEKGSILAKNVFLTSTSEIAIEVMKLVWKHNGDILRKCREKYGTNLCRACQSSIEPRVKRPKLKVYGSNKTSTELRE